jgi:hypothetical protein
MNWTKFKQQNPHLWFEWNISLGLGGMKKKMDQSNMKTFKKISEEK